LLIFSTSARYRPDRPEDARDLLPRVALIGEDRQGQARSLRTVQAGQLFELRLVRELVLPHAGLGRPVELGDEAWNRL